MRHRLELRGIQHLAIWNPVVAFIFRIGARTAAQNNYFVRHVGTELYHAKISSALVATAKGNSGEAWQGRAAAYSKPGRLKESRHPRAACCRKCSPNPLEAASHSD